MSTTTEAKPTAGRAGGLAIMAAVILSSIAASLFPGGPVVDTVDQTDFAAAVTALGANPGLAHAMTLGVIMSMLLYAYGFVELLRLRGLGAGFAVSLVRFGIVASLFSWGVFIIGFGFRHTATYFMQESLAAGEGTALQAELAGLALTSQVSMVGLTIAFMAVNPVGTTLVGLGLAPRFSKLNIYLVACYGLAVVGLGGLVNLMLALAVTDTDTVLHLTINQVLLLIGSLCLFALGVGMFRGRAELVAADDAG